MMKELKMLSQILVLVGALNWGLVGLIDLNLVSSILGEGSVFTRVVYILVGLAGAYLTYELFGNPKNNKK